MRRRIILLLSVFMLFLQQTWAQNHLVTHRFIGQKVSDGYFVQRPGTTIPYDDFCINTEEARNWLYLNESYLPTNGRMPWWSELVPGTPPHTYKSVRVLNLAHSSTIVQIQGLEDFFLLQPLTPYTTVIDGQYQWHWGSLAVIVTADYEETAVELYSGGFLIATMAVPSYVAYHAVSFDINGYPNADFEIRLRPR